MDQIRQLESTLRQSRQSINSMMGQINQQLQNCERMTHNIGNQLQGTNFNTSPQSYQYNTSTGNYGTQGQFNQGGKSQYAQNKNYYQSSMQKGGGVNQYGAHYSSGNQDEDVSQSYYQNKQTGLTGSQYNNNLTNNNLANNNNYNAQNMQNADSQYAQNNNYYQSSMQKGGGVNQYGAQYSSGKQDEDVSQSYYQNQNN